MKNFRIIKFGESQSHPSLGVSKLRETFDEAKAAGTEPIDIGDGYSIAIGDKSEKTGLSPAVVFLGDEPELAFYANPSDFAFGKSDGYAAVSSNGTLILLDFDLKEAASVYVGCDIREIQSIERVGNSLKVTVSGSFSGSEYEEHITINYRADTLVCVSLEINDSDKEDSGIGCDDSFDDDSD